MTPPTFIRFGDDGDMVFNTTEVLWFQHEDVKLTVQNRHMASPEEEAYGKLYGVRISVRNHPGLVLTCGTSEKRTELFNIIAKKLQTVVLRRPAEAISGNSRQEQPAATAPVTKRSRKSGLQDETIKPTDDLT